MSKEPKITGLHPLGPNESNYIRPMRLKYSLDGKQLAWDCLKAHDSVAIILYHKDRNKLIFVKQFRPSVVVASAFKINPDDGVIETNPSISGYTLELCAGIIDKPGLNQIEIAKEEVLEETGYDIPVSALQFVTSSRANIGLQASVHSIYFAEISDSQRVSKGGGVEDERIEVVELSLDEARKLMWCRDEDSPCSRPASMLLGLVWFLYEYYPKHYQQEKSQVSS